MRSAPMTVRPHLTLEQAAQRLEGSRTDTRSSRTGTAG